MLRLLSTAAAAALFLFAVSNVQAATEPVTIGVPTNPPLSMTADGKAQGILYDLTVKALEKMGYTVASRDLPFARLYQDIHSGAVDVAISVLKTPERATQAHYSEPVVTEYNVVAVKKGNAFTLDTTDNLAGRRIGTRNGFKYPLIDGRGDLTLDPGNDHLVNVRKLVANRLDGMIIGSITGVVQLQDNQFGDQIDILPNSLGAVPLGTALSAKRFTPDDLERFNATLRALRADPVFAEIVAKYRAGDLMKDYSIVPR